MRVLFCLLSLLSLGCTQSTYEVTDPCPTLDVSVLQNACLIDEPVYVQLKASQRGYSGAYRLSVTLNEGVCDLLLGDTKIQGNGSWISMPNALGMLSVTPRVTGRLRLMLEVINNEDVPSNRSAVNLNVAPSNTVVLNISYPEQQSITKPVLITLEAAKAGHSGKIGVKYDLLAGAGTLQYGYVGVAPEEMFSIPANNPQPLYYKASARGPHRLQFTATDGNITEYKIIEFFITN